MTLNQTHENDTAPNMGMDSCKELKCSISSLGSSLYLVAVSINHVKQMTNTMQAKLKEAQEKLLGCETDLEDYIEVAKGFECTK
jgi:hypothetical protein